MTMQTMGRAALAALLALALAAPHARAQDGDAARRARVVAEPRFGAEGLKALFLGDDYRDLWTTPVEVPTLDLGRFAGGLTPTEAGGGLQTRSLRFRGADGREYAFRSVNKWPSLADQPALENTPVADIIRDQTSALVPGAPAAAWVLVKAAGLLTVEPQLYVMPDDPRLGEFRETFAGMLGTLEERPDTDEERGITFAGADRVVSTERLYERLADDPKEQVDARMYLRARLVDVYLGDWDRHADQWRWAGYKLGDGAYRWVPIPRDRDYAFVDYDGLFMAIGRNFFPKAARFDTDFDDLFGLTINAQAMDRRFLAGLPWAVWDSTARDLQARLTDAVIADALARLPAEYQRLRGAELESRLRERRANLLEAAAREFYRRLSSEVDVHGSDEAERAEILRHPDGTLDVRLVALPEKAGEAERVTFERSFREDETEEVRVYLHGGDDRAVVRGEARKPMIVRVIGGAGDDQLADSSRVRRYGTWTTFHDAEGENRFVTRAGTLVDERPYQAPEKKARNLSGVPPRDWGASGGLVPWVDYKGEEGVIVGGGPSWTRYGFRSQPYQQKVTLRGAYAIGSGGLAADARVDLRRPNSPRGLELYARASQLEAIRFFGFGNESEFSGSARDFIVHLDQVRVEPSFVYRFSPRLEWRLGPVLKYTQPDADERSPLRLTGVPYGEGWVGQAGMQSSLLVDRADDAAFPTRGVTLETSGAFYPALWRLDEPFGQVQAVATGYVPLPSWKQPVLALRLGGKQLWGDYPVYEAAFLGGSRTLRGFHSYRYAGDAAVWGSAELRQPLTTVKLVLRGQLGVVGFADAGRVWYQDEESDTWHTSSGGGLFYALRFFDKAWTASAVYAFGEKSRPYVRLGFAF